MTILNDLPDREVLLKFVRPEHTKSTLDGKFHFGQSKHFIAEETEQQNKGIGDKAEGSWTRYLTENQKLFIESDGKFIPLHTKSAVYRNRYEAVENIPICCFVLLSVKDDFYHVPNTNQLKIKPEIDLELRQQFNERDIILYTSLNHLLDRFIIHCRKNHIPFFCNSITYYDDKTEKHPMTKEEYEAAPWKALLYKTNFFEFQKEYRMAINQSTEQNQIMDIGDTRDIASYIGQATFNEEIPFNIIFMEKEEYLNQINK